MFDLISLVTSMVHFCQNLPHRCYFFNLLNLDFLMNTCLPIRIYLLRNFKCTEDFILVYGSFPWNFRSLNPWFILRKEWVTSILVISFLFFRGFLICLWMYLSIFCILLVTFNIIIDLGVQPVVSNCKYFCTHPYCSCNILPNP